MTKNQSALEVKSWRARWILPINSPPLENGILVTEGDKILAVESSAREPCIELGDVAIVPGFINSHVHLDLPTLDWPIEGFVHFADWLRKVVALRQQITLEQLTSLIDENIQKVVAGGAVAVGDIATTDLSRERLEASSLSGIAFREVLGLREARYDSLWEMALADCAKSSVQQGKIRSGLTPHAPYSTSPILYERCQNLRSQIPLATHWFESQDELTFLKTGQGPIFEFLSALGAIPQTEEPARTATIEDPIGTLLGESGLNPWILVHGNLLRGEDILRLSGSQWRERIAGVIYCPRTHARFRHPPHSWRQLLAAGIPVAIGTDSLSTNPDLSIHEEGKFLAAQFPDLQPTTLLEMLTKNAAEILGLSDRLGDLSEGKSASFTLIDADFSQSEGPLAAIFSQNARVAGVVVAGRLQR